MPFTYLDHEADVGLEATGADACEALESGVQGLIELMVDPATVQPQYSTQVEAEGTDLGSLFVALLNRVLALQDITGQFFHRFELNRLVTEDDRLRARGTLWGEPVDMLRHDVANEVKAATYSGLRVVVEPHRVLLRCLLDV